MCSQIRRPGISDLHRHVPLSGYQFSPWSSGASEIHLLWPETLGQCMVRTTDLSICRRTRYHWTNAPRYYYNSSQYHCSHIVSILYFRVRSFNYAIQRPSVKIGRYKMIGHTKDPYKNPQRYEWRYQSYFYFKFVQNFNKKISRRATRDYFSEEVIVNRRTRNV